MGRALISDFAIMTPIGESHSEFAEKLFLGHSGIAKMNGDFPVQAVGLIPSLNGERKPMEIAQKLLRQIVKNHADKKIDGVVFFVPHEDELATHPSPLTGDQQISLFRSIIRADQWIGIHEACVSGLSGLALAAQRIRAGLWRRAVVLGVDLRCSPLDLLRFYALGALSLKPAPFASSPFSRQRDGFVRAQGAAIYLLEDETLAPESWGEIKGYGQSCDAWRLAEGRPDGAGAAHAIRLSLKMAGLSLHDIDCFSAHATSTVVGDALEARTIQAIWGESVSHLPITALKSQLGHAGQASGLLQVAAALFMMREQRLAPILNFQEPDPECHLDFVINSPRVARVRHVLCNATAFGGQNASLILGAVS